MNICIFPARKGSKRIKNKNTKLFNGLPIISYPIKQAIKSKVFNRLFISTDSKKICSYVKKFDIEAPYLRSKKLSDDKTGIIKVTKNYIELLRKKKIYPKYVCCILPTAVFINSKHLKKAFNILKINKKINYVFAAHKVDNAVLRSFTIKKNKKVEKMNLPKLYNTRSQDLSNVYVDSGQFYFARTSVFMNEKAVFTNFSKIIDVSSLKVIDINYIKDWTMAEKILKKK